MRGGWYFFKVSRSIPIAMLNVRANRLYISLFRSPVGAGFNQSGC